MNLLPFRFFNFFSVFALTLLVGSFLRNWYGLFFIWSIYFYKDSSRLRITVDLPLSVGKITIDAIDCNSFKTLLSFFEWLYLGDLELWSLRLILARIVSASSFLRSFSASSIVTICPPKTRLILNMRCLSVRHISNPFSIIGYINSVFFR